MWFVLLACSSPPSSIQSVPVEATKDLRPPVPAVVLTDLVDLLPEAPATLPPSLAGLTPKMPGEAARAILEAAHEPGVRIFGEMGEAQYALSTMLRGRTNVGVTLIFDNEGRILQEVDLSVPDEVAIPMLTTRWGAPTEQIPGDGAKMTMKWTPTARTPWRVELIPAASRDKAIVRYLPR